MLNLKQIYYQGKLCQKLYDFPGIDLNYIVHQPELRNKFISPISTNKLNRSSFDLINRNVVGKLIKKKLYKKAIKHVGKEYTEDYINEAEDRIFAISFFHLANSYYLMKELGYMYFVYKKFKYFPNEKSKVCKETDKIKKFDWYKYTKFMVENTGNDLKEQLAAYKQLISLDFLYQIYNVKLDARHYKIMLKILDTSLSFEFLNTRKKDNLIELKNKVLKRKKINNID